MSQLRDLLVEEIQNLLHAEQQLVTALPKMAAAANDQMLKENFEVHLQQTETHVTRLEDVLAMLATDVKTRPCKAMLGLVEEGEEKMSSGKQKEELSADLSLIILSQKIEHYEIAAYGNAKLLARQIGDLDVANVLCQILGEEQGADALLTMCAKPILQKAALADLAKSVRDLNQEVALPLKKEKARSKTSEKHD